MARFLFGTVWTARQSLRLTLGLMYPKEFMNKIYEGESSGGGGRTGWEVIEQVRDRDSFVVPIVVAYLFMYALGMASSD